MTYNNRVDPSGHFHADPAKGALMGNRGILHDDTRKILRTHAHQNWVACALSFNDRRRQIMAPGKYTELFFLDEATAFAAGHRPCATCRRDRYLAFTQAWRHVHGVPDALRSLPQTIDRSLHAARINRHRHKVTHVSSVDSLPNGAVFIDGAEMVLVYQRQHFSWNFVGYQIRDRVAHRNVTVLTPQPIIEVFRSGYTPQIHETAASILS
jgi:hypothetical protein